MKPRYILIVFFLFIALQLRCAHKMAPSGGPEDKIPPEVTRSFPPPDSVGIRSLPFVEVEFSEAIKRSSLQDNYWFIPFAPAQIKLEWKGNRKLRLYFPEALPANRTYVLTLGTGISDMHGNKMAAPFQLAFSTGSKLDRNWVSGRVYAASGRETAFIYAYPIGDNPPPDTLLSVRPPFFTQMDQDGHFKLNYLPDNRFRVFALLDKDLNGVYNLGADLIGIPFRDISLDSLHPSFKNLNFYLIQEDTAGPRLKSVDTLSRREIAVVFNEGISANRPVRGWAEDSLTGKKYAPLAFSFPREDSTRLSLFFSQMPPKQLWKLYLSGVADRRGNPTRDSVLVAPFTTPAREDTLPPQFKGAQPANGSADVSYNTRIRLRFSAPLDTISFKKAVVIFDEKKDTLSGDFNFSDLRQPLFSPDTLLKKSTTYTIQLRLGELKDLFQRAFPDTVLQINFTTRSWTELGEISGRVEAADSSWKGAIVQALPASGKGIYAVRARVGHHFELPFLPAGLYLLRVIADLNGNGKWDRGSTVPWQFSEPFFVNPDTVKVRKRWTTQGQILRFEF